MERLRATDLYNENNTVTKLTGLQSAGQEVSCIISVCRAEPHGVIVSAGFLGCTIAKW